MSLYKRKDSPYWWVKLSHNGQPLQKSTGTANRRQAQELHDKWKHELWEQERFGVKPKRSWDEAVLRYLNEKLGKASIETDKIHLRWLQPHLEGMELGMIDRDFGETLIEAGLKEGVESTTINRRLEILRAVLRMAAYEWKWIDTAPKLRFLPKKPPRDRFATQIEVAELLRQLPDHQRAMAAFALCTGLRQANVKNLGWLHVNFEKCCAWVDADEAKGRKGIAVPLTPDAITILKAQQGKHEQFVFPYNGKPVSQVSTKAWKAALSRAGLKDFHWHDLRHTWASWHVQSGTPVIVLRELGAWSTMDMVRRYAHLASDHLKQYADRFSAAMPLPLASVGYDLATRQEAQAAASQA